MAVGCKSAAFLPRPGHPHLTAIDLFCFFAGSGPASIAQPRVFSFISSRGNVQAYTSSSFRGNQPLVSSHFSNPPLLSSHFSNALISGRAIPPPLVSSR